MPALLLSYVVQQSHRCLESSVEDRPLSGTCCGAVCSDFSGSVDKPWDQLRVVETFNRICVKRGLLVKSQAGFIWWSTAILAKGSLHLELPGGIVHGAEKGRNSWGVQVVGEARWASACLLCPQSHRHLFHVIWGLQRGRNGSDH